jgi:Arc/MetJ-type ribon-helix-helix transcriptional regulator
MKTLTVRLPEPLVADIEEESRDRKISKSDVVRERLQLAPRLSRRRIASFNAIADLVGSVDGLPSDLTGSKKAYLRATGYGKKRSR